MTKRFGGTKMSREHNNSTIIGVVFRWRQGFLVKILPAEHAMSILENRVNFGMGRCR